MTATNQPDRSPAPGIIPGPVHVADGAAPPPAVPEERDEPKARRNPVRIAGAKVISALRGDKYMVGAYPVPGEAAGSRRRSKGNGTEEGIGVTSA